jgi:hypothetical protein
MFARELVEHTGGYHQTYGQVDRADALKWFAQRSLRCPRTYLDFLSEIGPGNYFSGGLVLFEVELGGLVDQVTEKLGCDGSDYLAIGYDGTTDGYYCMKNSETDEAVYWYDSETKAIGPHHRSFVEWVEECPRTLFSHSVYAGYKRIKDLAQVRRVIRERMSFDVRLLRYDRQTVRPPKKEKDFLPRYHRIICLVRKNNNSSLGQLTVKVCRTGSSVGADNVQYVTIDLPDFLAGQEKEVEVFVFDPFNLPFKDIVIDYSPQIDLSSPSRARFVELKPYL